MRRAAWLLPVASLLLAACSEAPPPQSPVPGGDPTRAPAALFRHGCGTCHVIPGVPGANGTTGPHLRHYARQSYVAGVLPNRPETLVDFILNPRAVDERSAMPNLDISEDDARDIAAYLYVSGEGR